MKLKQAIFASSVSFALALPAAAASDCVAPRVLHTMPMVALRDGRFAIQVMFGAEPGKLVLDSAGVAVPTVGQARQTAVPTTRTDLQEAVVDAPSYAGVAGSLTSAAVQKLGLKSDVTGGRVVAGGKDRSEEKVTVPELSFQGLTPFKTQFLIAKDDGRTLDYSGTFSINNFRQISFEFDLDFAARTVRFFSREHCSERAVDWTTPTVSTLKFTIDGNGYIRFPVTVDGKEVLAVLDTGLGVTSLDFAYAGRIFGIKKGDPSLTKVRELPDGRVVYSRPFQTIAFGDIKVESPTIILVPDALGRGEGTAPTGSRVNRATSGSLPPLVVGMSVLRNLRVHISPDEGRLYFAQGEPRAP